MAFRNPAPAGALALLLLYGLVLVLASQRLTVFEDEATVVAVASRDAGETIAQFLSGQGLHEHPPLYDLLLHAWIPYTDREPAWLRFPSIVFYCAALWLGGATAELLWHRRLLGVALGVAWPLGYFWGTPAYWSGLAMLGVAGSTWAYFAWRRSSQTRHLAAFVSFGIALVYTNYLGWAFLGFLGLHFLLSRPGGRAFRRALGAGLLVVLAYAPMIPAFLGQLQGGTRIDRSLLLAAADAVYLGYALLVSESVAPWQWPAVFAVIGIAALAFVALRTPQMLWLLALIVVLYLCAIGLGVIHNRRISMFGPWLVLYLTGLLATTRLRRTAAVAVLLIFGTGWAGIVGERWYATFRHVEPWDEVAATALESARPGDLILASHPSFYFYVARRLGWEVWQLPRPSPIEERSGFVFADTLAWQEALAGRPRLLFVHGAAVGTAVAEERRLAEFLGRHFRMTLERRYVEDAASAFKNRFLGNQPRWRIELHGYERVAASGSP